MPRVKRSVHARKKRRKVLGEAKGYWGLKKSSYKYAKEQVEHSLAYAYRDRKNKKRTFRRLWIVRINAAARQEGSRTTSSSPRLRKAEITLDRKVLAELAVSDPQAFGMIAKQAKAALEPEHVRSSATVPPPGEYCAPRSPLYAVLCERLVTSRSSATSSPSCAGMHRCASSAR